MGRRDLCTRRRLACGVASVVALGLALGCDAPAIGEFPWSDGRVLERMDALGVPAASVAVIDDLEVMWSRGYGTVQAPDGPLVGADTLFQTASVGKPVTAMTVLHQVGSGRVDLDSDVAASLKTWTLPEGAQSAANPVTLRRLLSHTAGMTESGFAGYPRGSPLPTLDEILDGAPPANSPPAEVVVPPGTGFRYSNLGFEVAEKLLEDVTGQRFVDLVASTVLGPLGMSASHHDPLPPELWPRAARGHLADGSTVPGGWRTFPEYAAAGFWTTPTDLARFGIDVMRSWRDGSGVVMSQDLALQMLTPADGLGGPISDASQVSTGYGLGFEVGDDGGDRFYATHDGGQTGFRTTIVLYPERGQGIVVMTNSETGDALIDELLTSASRGFGWYSGVILTTRQTAALALGIAAVTVGGAASWSRWHRRRRRAKAPA
jgi:CubicO group peptidase (beta-lactamase class C family)